jgi:DNA-binding NarL/FixJ family response regulator
MLLGLFPLISDMEKRMSIRVVIADDHSMVRQGLKVFLSLDPELEVIGEAVNGKQAVELAHNLHPDVILMDLVMPVMSGVEATALIRQQLSDVEVIALTSILEDSSVRQVI